MKYNPDIHHRRSIRLKNYDYAQPGAYFITICTHNRQNLFGEFVDGEMILNEYGKIARQCWLEIPLHYPNVLLDEFIVMPNHLHGIVVINNVGAIHELPLQNNPKKQRRIMIIPKIIGRFKMNSAKQINVLRQTSGTSVWQRNFYEHIIRNENELDRIREYIINNPLKWSFDLENPERQKDYKSIQEYFEGIFKK